jgi:potassium efflux system protein
VWAVPDSVRSLLTGWLTDGIEIDGLRLLPLRVVVALAVLGLLLFERPIRRGDWIVVGGTEGRVRHISIRSTKIRTFDRSDVVVSNSELISGQVTNWTLRDPVGRVRVPVGVAYGSDLGRVRETLLGIASAQPQILADSTVPAPTVLFLGFGDSALNLELRFFVRDVNQRLTVLSEVNFAIDTAFREAGIEIPFPQRDLHLRTGGASADPQVSPRLARDDQRGADADSDGA